MTSPKFRTIVRLVIEYVLITMPIVIYVSLEAIHHKSAAYLLQSPEWSIATIFLSFQTVRIFWEEMEQDQGRFGILLLIVLVTLSIAASVSIYMGLESGAGAQSWYLLATKWALLAVATLLFVYFAGASIWAKEAHR